MIAVDSSSLIAYLQGEEGRDVDLIDAAIDAQKLAVPPMVVTEVLTDAAGRDRATDVLRDVPMLLLSDGFWQRAAILRGLVLKTGRRAYLAEALIAQACLDADIPLITRDADFAAFAAIGGLKLA